MKTNANGNALQEQPKTGVMPTNPTKVVVLQHGPKVDEATAAAIASVYYKKLGFQVQIWSFRNQYPDHVWMEEWWTKDGVAPLLIDVGKEKYHQPDPDAPERRIFLANSALEYFLKQHPELGNTRVLQHLVEIINKNNDAKSEGTGGFLKKPDYSIAGLLRKMPYIEAEYYGEEHLDRFFDVVWSYFRAEKKVRKWEEIEAPRYQNFQNIWFTFEEEARTRNGKKKPLSFDAEVGDFTIPLYFKHLFESGEAYGVVESKILWWLNLRQFVKEKQAAADRKLYRTYSESIPLPGQGCINLLTATVDSYFESEAIINKYINSGKMDLAIIKHRSSGHVVIIGKKGEYRFDLDNFIKRLQQIEGLRWYREYRFGGRPLIMNGNPQFDQVPSTELSIKALVSQLRQTIRPLVVRTDEVNVVA